MFYGLCFIMFKKFIVVFVEYIKLNKKFMLRLNVLFIVNDEKKRKIIILVRGLDFKLFL